MGKLRRRYQAKDSSGVVLGTPQPSLKDTKRAMEFFRVERNGPQPSLKEMKLKAWVSATERGRREQLEGILESPTERGRRELMEVIWGSATEWGRREQEVQHDDDDEDVESTDVIPRTMMQAQVGEQQRDLIAEKRRNLDECKQQLLQMKLKLKDGLANEAASSQVRPRKEQELNSHEERVANFKTSLQEMKQAVEKAWKLKEDRDRKGKGKYFSEEESVTQVNRTMGYPGLSVPERGNRGQDLHLDRERSEVSMVEQRTGLELTKSVKQILRFDMLNERGKSSYNLPCKLYTARAKGESGYVTIAWAVRDASDSLVTEGSKTLGWDVADPVADYTAVADGVAAAVTASVRKIHIYCNSSAVFGQVVASCLGMPCETTVLDELKVLREQLEQFTVEHDPDVWNEYTARSAHDLLEVMNLDNDVYRSDQLSTSFVGSVITMECPICFDSVLETNVFELKPCLHRFCTTCLEQQVRSCLESNRIPVKCLEECSSFIEVDGCKGVLDPMLVDQYARSLAEAIIPEHQRVYCPFPNCSSLMWKDDVIPFGEASSSGGWCTECMECHRLFCAACGVPWHADMTCEEYQALPVDMRSPEDIKLLDLAVNHHWQRCQNCHSMVELQHGCYHITCRCGFEFCYKCGVPWVKKKAACRCKLWDEENIRY